MDLLNCSQVFIMEIHTTGCCRYSSSLFCFSDETCAGGCWAFGMLHVRVFHNVPKDVLMGTERSVFSASFLQLDCVQDILQGIPGVIHCGHSKDSLWKPNESFTGMIAVQYGQNQKVFCCCYIQTCTQHRPTASALSVLCNVPLKLLRLALLSIWER